MHHAQETVQRRLGSLIELSLACIWITPNGGRGEVKVSYFAFDSISIHLTKRAEIVPQFPEHTWQWRDPTLHSQRMFNEERFDWSLKLSLFMAVVLLIQVNTLVVSQRWYSEHWWHHLKMLYGPFETFSCFLWCCFLFQQHWWLFLDRKMFVKLWDESDQLNVSHCFCLCLHCWSGHLLNGDMQRREAWS